MEPLRKQTYDMYACPLSLTNTFPQPGVLGNAPVAHVLSAAVEEPVSVLDVAACEGAARIRLAEAAFVERAHRLAARTQVRHGAG